ncbi:hypothetical protein GGI64_004137 [Rhizobium leguminosarum]|uniref:TIR domain-containing protein n=1 Tax=Rhizobium leguminosarum TaxID=384 RepID=A0A7Z0IZQ0_RHILE|nr:toll/interleukin-1 receptor domain-containing protein [Rhizobium leguminosarum]NYJ13056.1 hypothetical protein [Rhizobium leguminosarum]
MAEIEEILRNRCGRFIFVISKSSVGFDRGGVRNELSVADAVGKKLSDRSFIIPLRIDDTASEDFPIQLHQLHALNFAKGWGEKLSELLDVLDEWDVARETDPPLSLMHGGRT